MNKETLKAMEAKFFERWGAKFNSKEFDALAKQHYNQAQAEVGEGSWPLAWQSAYKDYFTKLYGEFMHQKILNPELRSEGFIEDLEVMMDAFRAYKEELPHKGDEEPSIYDMAPLPYGGLSTNEYLQLYGDAIRARTTPQTLVHVNCTRYGNGSLRIRDMRARVESFNPANLSADEWRETLSYVKTLETVNESRKGFFRFLTWIRSRAEQREAKAWREMLRAADPERLQRLEDEFNSTRDLTIKNETNRLGAYKAEADKHPNIQALFDATLQKQALMNQEEKVEFSNRQRQDNNFNDYEAAKHIGKNKESETIQFNPEKFENIEDNGFDLERMLQEESNKVITEETFMAQEQAQEYLENVIMPAIDEAREEEERQEELEKQEIERKRKEEEDRKRKEEEELAKQKAQELKQFEKESKSIIKEEVKAFEELKKEASAATEDERKENKEFLDEMAKIQNDKAKEVKEENKRIEKQEKIEHKEETHRRQEAYKDIKRQQEELAKEQERIKKEEELRKEKEDKEFQAKMDKLKNKRKDEQKEIKEKMDKKNKEILKNKEKQDAKFAEEQKKMQQLEEKERKLQKDIAEREEKERLKKEAEAKKKKDQEEARQKKEYDKKVKSENEAFAKKFAQDKKSDGVKVSKDEIKEYISGDDAQKAFEAQMQALLDNDQLSEEEKAAVRQQLNLDLGDDNKKDSKSPRVDDAKGKDVPSKNK